MIINSIGYNFCHDKNFRIERPQGLDEYLLLTIRSKAYFGPKSKKSEIEANSLVVFRKKTPQYFGASDDIYINDWISFDMSPEEEKVFGETIVFDKIIQSEDIGVCSEIIRLMQNEFYSSAIYKEELTHLYFQIIRKKLDKMFGSFELKTKYYNELLSIRTDIHNNPWKKHSVKALAAEISISESYFQHLYKEYFGVSPIADEINSRVEYSKHLLSSSNYSVREISEMLNYSCDTQYMKQFKTVTRMTPREYRKTFFSKSK